MGSGAYVKHGSGGSGASSSSRLERLGAIWQGINTTASNAMVVRSMVKAKFDRHGNKRSMVARGLRTKAHGETYSDVLRKRFAANALKRVQP